MEHDGGESARPNSGAPEPTKTTGLASSSSPAWLLRSGSFLSLAWLLALAARVVPEFEEQGLQGLLALILSIAAAGVLWSGIDSVDRSAQKGSVLSSAGLVGVARAGLVVLLVLAALNPSVLAGWDQALAMMSAGHAEADTTIFQAEQICADAAVGDLRLSTRERGCRDNEVSLSPDAGAQLLGATSGADFEYRAGESTLLAGHGHIAVRFSKPMPSADYLVTITPSSMARPISPDEACRFASIAGKSTEGFGITMRRCWFEGEDVPADPILEDLRLDWIAIAPR